jgi:hypothetical protein
VLLTVKSNQKTLYRQIGSQFQGKRHIPFTASDHEKRHGRDTLWELSAKEAPAVVRLLIPCQHPEGQVRVAGPLDLARGDYTHAVGVEQQQRKPLCGRLRLHLGVKTFLTAEILALSRDQDL